VALLLVDLMAAPSTVVAPCKCERGEWPSPNSLTSETPGSVVCDAARRGADAVSAPRELLDAAGRAEVPTAEDLAFLRAVSGRRAVDVLILVFVSAFTSKRLALRD
jgi:hypothetical protein